MTSTPPSPILYSIIAFNEIILIEVHLRTPNTKKKKYVKGCRKILKKISRNELRRLHYLDTILSGSYAYNYMHGSDIPQSDNSIDSLIFLCVTKLSTNAKSAMPTDTKKYAETFLNHNRQVFMQQFGGELQTLYRATQNFESSDDPSNIMISDKTRSDLRVFAASLKDQMVNIVMPVTRHSSNSNSVNSGDDKDWSSSVDITEEKVDLRQPPPRSLASSTSYQQSSLLGQEIARGEHGRGALEMVIDRNPMEITQNDRLFDKNRHDQQEEMNEQIPLVGNVGFNKHCQSLYKRGAIFLMVLILVVYLFGAVMCGWSWKHCG